MFTLLLSVVTMDSVVHRFSKINVQCAGWEIIKYNLSVFCIAASMMQELPASSSLLKEKVNNLGSCKSVQKATEAICQRTETRLGSNGLA